MMNQKQIVLTFKESELQGEKFSQHLGLEHSIINIHKFPDGESLVTVPDKLPEHTIFFRSLDRPNDKLIELLLASKTARNHGAKRLTLIAPYLCYMRQDIENNPGEAISQRIIGQLLADIFDDVITVDSHLHRINQLEQAIPLKNAVNLLSTHEMTTFLASHFNNAIIFGPDSESEQWVSEVASSINFDFAVATKIRKSDRHVEITIPDKNYHNEIVVIVDDMASTGRTIGLAAQQLKQQGAAEVHALVTHALFMGDAKDYLKKHGVDNIWSTDSITDESNKVELTILLANALLDIQ